jgi:predicted transcriptional regulator
MRKTMRKKKDPVKELAQEVDVLDHMLASLVEILEDKGVMTTEEWEAKIREKIEKIARTHLSYRDLES